MSIPTLVLCGGESPAWMIEVGRQIATTLPNGQLRILEGQEHGVAPEIRIPVLAEFFADRDDEPNCSSERVVHAGLRTKLC